MNETRPRSSAAIAALLDHAILHPTVTPAKMLEEVEATAGLGLASLCVRPSDVPAAVERSAGRVPVGTVIGFPHGTTSTAAKVAESERAIADGAAELDVVVHVAPRSAATGTWSGPTSRRCSPRPGGAARCSR